MSDSAFLPRRRELVLAGRTASLTEIGARTGQAYPFELFRLLVELVSGRGGMVLLSAPVPWREVLDRHPDADQSRWSQPLNLAHSLGPRFSCVRLDDLRRGPGEDFVTVDERGAVVPPERRARRSRPLVIRFPEDFPLVIGSSHAIHALASAAPASPHTFRARDPRVDFAAFDHLWHGPPGAERDTVEKLLRTPGGRNGFAAARETGETFGSAHRNASLVGDGREPVALVHHPGDAQCAADFSPLLPAMRRPQWLAFRAGYLCGRPDGQGVLDLVEHGDTTGWARAARRGDWATAHALVRTQLTTSDQADPRPARACDLIGRRALTDPVTVDEHERAMAFARSRSGPPATTDEAIRGRRRRRS
ncbi:hypothetical protein ACIGNX_27720 [Actinosynnema sp. NPDC053489]|uniref:hypothetical protein n=1 Tax=Actinosynnema sp. NPDC053489 TaxID=3363916 RepID=UPI0037CB0600